MTTLNRFGSKSVQFEILTTKIVMTTDGSDPSTWFNIPSRSLAPFRENFLEYGGDAARIRVIFPDPKKLKFRNPNGWYAFPTVHGKGGETTLSPMMLGPCRLY